MRECVCITFVPRDEGRLDTTQAKNWLVLNAMDHHQNPIEFYEVSSWYLWHIGATKCIHLI
jgi:hypothetical protein